MKNRKIKRPILVTFVCIVVVCAVISVIQIIFPGRDREASTSEEAFQEDPMESQTGLGSGNSSSTGSQAGSGKESAEGSTGEDVSLEFHEEGSSSISETQIGSVTVKFHTDDAMVGEGTVLGEQMDSILFHDGIEEDMKGYMFATKVDYDGGTIDSIEAAQSSVSEYIPAGSGITSNWEETEEYFIRKATGYDNEADGAFIFYTVIPKSDRSDPFFYSIVAVGYENDLIKESSYDSMMDAMYGHIPDSSLLDLTYDEACTELEEALYNQSGAGEKLGMNGVDELRDANMQWYHDVYGVDSMEEYEAMSEEEKKERYWKYKDPVGYAQMHEEEIAAEKAAQGSSEGPEDREETASATDPQGEIDGERQTDEDNPERTAAGSGTDAQEEEAEESRSDSRADTALESGAEQ